MERLTFLLSVPGELLVAAFFAADFPVDSEARAHLAVTLGIAAWSIALLAGFVAWRRVGPTIARHAAAGGRAAARNAGPALRLRWTRLRAVARTWNWTRRDALAAAWRAEVVHLLIYVAAPLAWEAARLAVLVVSLPFAVMSFADQGPFLDRTLNHFHEAGCWIVVAPCSGPHFDGFERRPVDVHPCRPPAACAPEPSADGSGGEWRWRLVWLAASLLWIARWRCLSLSAGGIAARGSTQSGSTEA